MKKDALSIEEKVRIEMLMDKGRGCIYISERLDIPLDRVRSFYNSKKGIHKSHQTLLLEELIEDFEKGTTLDERTTEVYTTCSRVIVMQYLHGQKHPRSHNKIKKDVGFRASGDVKILKNYGLVERHDPEGRAFYYLTTKGRDLINYLDLGNKIIVSSG